MSPTFFEETRKLCEAELTFCREQATTFAKSHLDGCEKAVAEGRTRTLSLLETQLGACFAAARRRVDLLERAVERGLRDMKVV